MEHFRQSDDPTADSVTSLYPTDSFLLTPEFEDENTVLNDQNTDKYQQPPQPKALFRRFERPSIARIAILIVLCVVAYPALYVVKLVAKDLPLFTVRVIVAVGCTAIGFALRYSLLGIGVRHIEAATWATLIQMSYEETGMKLGDLARNSEDPTSILSALRLFLYRLRSRKNASRSRGLDRQRPWSLFIGFFILLTILTALLPFLFGRIMAIETFVRNQRMVYSEILVAGDLSKDEVDRASKQLEAIQGITQTTAMLPYGMTPPDYVQFPYGNETVYFSKPSLSQFTHGGSGLGTFDANRTASLEDGANTKLALLGIANAASDGIGVVVRYPQWGVRIHCKKLPDPEANL